MQTQRWLKTGRVSDTVLIIKQAANLRITARLLFSVTDFKPGGTVRSREAEVEV